MDKVVCKMKILAHKSVDTVGNVVIAEDSRCLGRRRFGPIRSDECIILAVCNKPKPLVPSDVYGFVCKIDECDHLGSVRGAHRMQRAIKGRGKGI